MPTRNDIARLAGVSGASVARAFNQPEVLSKETYEKIMSVARELNYHPNYFGKALKSKLTKQVYAYCPELENPFFIQVYMGLEEYFQVHDYQVFLTRHFNREMIHQGRYDGFLFPVYSVDSVMEDIQYLQKNHYPLVVTNFSNTTINNIPSVKIDVEFAGYCLTEHLAQLGHKNILFASDFLDNKWKGIEACSKKYHMSANYSICAPNGKEKNFFDIGEQLGEIVLSLPHKPTAIIAGNDEIAIGLLGILIKHGYRIPEDISVAGFDDTNIAAYSLPALTTIRYPKYEIGYSMAQMLDSIIQNEPYQRCDIKTELIQRQSTSSLSNK